MLSILIIVVLWRTLIVNHKGIVHTSLDVSSLAKVTDGYTPGHIDEVCMLSMSMDRNVHRCNGFFFQFAVNYWILTMVVGVVALRCGVDNRVL